MAEGWGGAGESDGGMTGEAAGDGFVGGGTWPMGAGRVRRLEVTMQ
jgi:hypothetical protein